MRIEGMGSLVVGIGVDRRLVGRGCVAGRWIGRRDRLRLDRRRPAEGRVIENRKIFGDRAASGRIEVFDLGLTPLSMVEPDWRRRLWRYTVSLGAMS
jgi:hypothetical protein